MKTTITENTIVLYKGRKMIAKPSKSKHPDHIYCEWKDEYTGKAEFDYFEKKDLTISPYQSTN